MTSLLQIRTEAARELVEFGVGERALGDGSGQNPAAIIGGRPKGVEQVGQTERSVDGVKTVAFRNLGQRAILPLEVLSAVLEQKLVQAMETAYGTGDGPPGAAGGTRAAGFGNSLS